MRILTLFLLLATALALPGCRKQTLPSPDRVAVGNSYLECAARDLLGTGTPLAALGGSGQCPGHFDIRPGQVEDLSKCRVLLRFDFQRSLDEKLSRAVDRGLRIVTISPPGGLCVPESYLAVCRQAAQALVAAGFLTNEQAEDRLARIQERMNILTETLRFRVRQGGLTNLCVLACDHQADFARWLGLRVVGAFGGGDNPAAVERVLAAGRKHPVCLVIGNVPQGDSLPNRLADRLGAAAVMFENFPASGDSAGAAFDAMVQRNVTKLIESATP